MDKEKYRMEVTFTDKYTGEEKTFLSIRKASEHFGMSASWLSEVIRGKRPNRTRYFITTS